VPHVARAAARTIRLGHNNAPNAPFGFGAQAMADAVAAHPVLGSVLRIDGRGNAELGDEMALLQGCMNGTVEMGMAVTSLAANLVPEAGLLDAAFLFGTVARGRTAMVGVVGAEYAELLRGKSIDVLAWAENGLRHFTANSPSASRRTCAG
jgi:TRAP-type C4-dicarboxylate transport system substrate-binding protein